MAEKSIRSRIGRKEVSANTYIYARTCWFVQNRYNPSRRWHLIGPSTHIRLLRTEHRQATPKRVTRRARVHEIGLKLITRRPKVRIIHQLSKRHLRGCLFRVITLTSTDFWPTDGGFCLGQRAHCKPEGIMIQWIQQSGLSQGGDPQCKQKN